jgi:hypothetical protein
MRRMTAQEAIVAFLAAHPQFAAVAAIPWALGQSWIRCAKVEGEPLRVLLDIHLTA